MHRKTRALKYRSPRSIATITEGIIDEFGEEEGPVRMCIGICQTLFDNPDDPAYIRDFDRWTRVVNQVCARRNIPFDAEQVCAGIISDIWNNTFKKSERRQSEQPALLEDGALLFERAFTEADMIHARGMGISLES